MPQSATSPAACTYDALSSGVPQSLAALTALTFTMNVNYWCAIGVRPQPGEDWDIGVFATTGSPPDCVDNPLASSTGGTGVVDFVVGDFNFNAHGQYYALADPFAGTGPGTVEWDDDQNVITINDFGTQRSTGPNDVLECWDVFLTQGVPYTVSLGQTGATQADLFLFRNAGGVPTWQVRTDATLALVGTGNGVSATYTAPSTGWYGLVVTNENGGAGTYAFRVDQCAPPAALTSELTVTASRAPSPYQFAQATHYWSGVATRPLAHEDWNTFVYANHPGGIFPGCFANLEDASSSIVDGVDLVVGDFNYTPTGTYFAAAVPTGFTSTPALVEWESGSQILTVDDPPLVHPMAASELVKMWDVYLSSGTTYRLHFSPQSTTGGAAPNCTLLLFRNHSGAFPYWSTRQFADVQTQAIETDYVAPATAWYGLAVVNDDGGAGQVSVGVFDPGVGVQPAEHPLMTRFAAVAPNPVRGAARFAFELEHAARVGFEIVDLAGRIVARVPDAPHGAGPASVSWSARGTDAGAVGAAGLRAGVYFVRMRVDGAAVATRRLVLIP